MDSGFDKFLSETSGMGPVPNAQRGAGGRAKSNTKKSRSRRARNTYSPGTVPARNKPNKSGGGIPLGGGGGGGGR